MKRYSLRWRLPLFACALTAGMLALVLWLAYREVEATLVHAAGERAQASADQIATLFERSVQQGIVLLQRTAQDAVVQAYLARPSEPAREAARRALAAAFPSGPLRIELWNRAGVRLLELSVPGPPGPDGSAVVLPAGPPPSAAGRAPLEALGDVAFSDHVVDVVAGETPGATRGTPIGYLRTRSTTAENPPGIMRRVLGGTAAIQLGTRGGAVWTDLTRVTPAPPADTTRRGVAEYRAADGGWRVGAVGLVRDTPYATWVEFERAAITAPARAFLYRMILLSLGVIALSAIIATVVSVRLTRPLLALSRAADDIAAGDFSQRVDAHRRDEIGRLGTAFNTMTEQVARDFAARTQAEVALREREESFQALFAGNPLPMWVYDAETLTFLEVNDAAVRKYGYGREEFLQMTIADIRPPEDVPRLMTAIAGERETFQQAGQWRHRLKSGRIINVDIESHTLTFGGRPAALVVAQDVTEREELQAQLRQSQKLEAVGQLAGGVAHDFNNLLTAIIGYGALIMAELPAGDPVRGSLEEIRKAADSAASLTRQLLAFSRRQILQPQVLDLNDVVRRMHSLLKRLIGEDIDLDTRLSPSLAHVKADPGQMEQIVMNLAVNARDAMPRGGRLTIETANVTLDEAYVRQHAETTPGPYVMLAVSDTGMGMDADTRARMFEPFFTTKEAGKGTGLGLATVYGIVRQSGGFIWVYSERGHGATFKIYLPVAAEHLTAVTPAAASAASLEGTETILVAEDQAEVRAVVRAILTRYGYTVLEAAHGEAALRMLGEHTGRIHLLLTDVVMPSLSGRELAAQLQQSHPDIKVLFTSGYTDDAIVRHGTLEAGVAFLQKPFTPRALVAKVREVLDTQA